MDRPEDLVAASEVAPEAPDALAAAGEAVAECASCRGYLRTVDLRERGSAVPLVEDLAYPELDAWADEHGLWKIGRDLPGL